MPSEAKVRLTVLLERLKVPPVHPDGISNSATNRERKERLAQTMQDILVLVKTKQDLLSLEDQGNIIFGSVCFSPAFCWECSNGCQYEPDQIRDEAEWDWTTSESVPISEDLFISSIFSSPSQDLVAQVLTHNLKSIFKSNPHPHLHAVTGRKLPGAAGGSMAMQDYYEGQTWKDYPAIANVVLWCVHHLETDAYENKWHLIIPPIMTLMDDYEAKYKLQGVVVVQEMLRHVPKDLLRRTGIDGLLRQSLRTSLSHLQSQETPSLLQRAINASVELTLLTTPIAPVTKPSSERFDQLCSLLGEGIISGIWLYADDKPTAIRATFNALPLLLKALGIGSTRFMQALIPQLMHTLIPRPLIEPDRKMQLSALKVLETILDVCSLRINSWKETILDGVVRCWVEIIDEERKDLVIDTNDALHCRERVKKRLQNICIKLAVVCPSVKEEEYPRFLAVDKTLFEDLIPNVYC